MCHSMPDERREHEGLCQKMQELLRDLAPKTVQGICDYIAGIRSQSLLDKPLPGADLVPSGPANSP